MKASENKIADMKSPKEALPKGEDFYRYVIRRMPDTLLIVDKNGIMLVVSEMAEKLSGYPESEVIGKSIFSLNFLDIPTKAMIIKRLAFHFSGNDVEPFEIMLHRKDGNAVPVEISATILEYNGKKFDVVLLRDITERKLIAENVKNSEELYRTLTQSISDSIYFLDENQCIKFVNSTAAKKHNVNQNDMVCRSIDGLFNPETAGFLKEKIAEVLKNGQPVVGEFQDNPGTWSEIRISPVIKESGKPDSVIIISHDITKRKAAEKSVIESESNFRNLVENSLVGIYKTNLNGQILFANQALLKMFGYKTLEEMQKVGLMKLYANAKDRERLIDTLKKNRSTPNFEAIFNKSDNKQMNVLLSATLDDNEISGMMMDITDRKIVEGRFAKMNDELNAKISELERFNKVAIGRELRMIELKKKIAELEGGHGK